MIRSINRKQGRMKTGGWFPAGVLVFFHFIQLAAAQGTLFTYQGQLTDGGNPAGGIYDLRFAIYDAVTNGNAVGGPLTNSATPVNNGLFTVALDFGSNAFSGAGRWLEIAARTNGSNAFVTLSPRQQLTAAPYAITAGNLTGPLPAGSLSGVYGGAVTLNNPANGFTGNGAGLTNVPAAGVTGLKPMAFQDTNAPVFNGGRNYGYFTIFTNAAFPLGGLNLDAGGNASMFWNQTHPGGGEFQIVSDGSMAFGGGFNLTHNATLQIGSSAAGFQGYGELINFQDDSAPDAAHLLGYSHLVQWINRYWDGSFAAFSAPAGVRSEAMDTNGNSALMFYNPTGGSNVPWGQSPGRLQLGVLPDGALLTGKFLRALITPVVYGTYAIDFSQSQFAELTLTTNLTLYVTNLLATNYTLEKDIYLRPETNSWALTFPSDWLWEGDSMNNVAPTNLLAQTALHLHLTANCGSQTNIYARASFAPYFPLTDTNMLQFTTAAGISNPTIMIALNRFALAAKAHGYWTNLIAIYPMVGGASNTCSWNLKNTNTYRIAWSGAMTFDATGITGDGTTAYGSTGIDPSLAMPGAQNSAFAAVWIRGPASPTDGGYFFSCAGNNSSGFGMDRGGSLVNVDGVDNDTQGELSYFTAGNFIGLAGECRLDSTTQVDFVASIALGGTVPRSPTTAVPAGQPVTLLAQYQNGAANFSNANLSWAFVGSGLTAQNVADLITDAATCNAILGR